MVCHVKYGQGAGRQKAFSRHFWYNYHIIWGLMKSWDTIKRSSRDRRRNIIVLWPGRNEEKTGNGQRLLRDLPRTCGINEFDRFPTPRRDLSCQAAGASFGSQESACPDCLH